VSAARTRIVTLTALVVAAGSCGGNVVTLGRQKPTPFRFGAPVLVSELGATGRRENPTLTADLLEIYFTTNEDPNGNGDVWSAQRASVDAPFAGAAPVDGVNTTSYETSSAVSADGLTLWLGSDRPGGSGGIDVWVSQRASRTSPWSTPTNVAELNTSADDIPRPPGQRQLVMPLASTKKTPSNDADRNYQTYLASRAGPLAPFQSPLPIAALDTLGRSVVDGLLTDDGLVLFFSSPAGSFDPLDAGSAPDGAAPDADIFIAFRRTTDGPFTDVLPASDLDTAANERDPWLSPDRSIFYFTSDREGETYIYAAPVLPR
jgi:hypothetical protein